MNEALLTFCMEQKRHKRKNSHVVIVTSDAVDAGVRQFRIRPWVLQALILVLCVLIGALIGYLYYDNTVWSESAVESAARTETIEELQQRNAELEAEILSLNDTIQILSETVNQKIQNESELSAQLEKQTTPTEFPLKGAATMEEVAEGDPMLVFSASAGTMVVATAGGVVTAVNDDPEYGHNVWIDHGNGYITVYRNAAESKVKQGETVTQGTTIFLIENDSDKLGYQMLYEGAFINPMEMLAISG